MGLPNVTRNYTSFLQLARQAARSRIHGGIHFQFDTDGGEPAGRKVAEYTYANYMLPRSGRREKEDGER
jgi:hypothetical protein